MGVVKLQDDSRRALTFYPSSVESPKQQPFTQRYEYVFTLIFYCSGTHGREDQSTKLLTGSVSVREFSNRLSTL